MPTPGGRKAPKPLDDSEVVRDDDYKDFIEKLRKWHEDRRTEFTPEPDLGRKVMDLRSLYKTVCKMGGYDDVTVEKGAWRVLANTYRPTVSNTNAGFILKTIYYKNLLSYEIKHHWNEEPPPKERLEDWTAKGGAVRSRTEEEWAEIEAERKSGGDQDEMMQDAPEDTKEGLTPGPAGLSRSRSNLEENSPTPSAQAAGTPTGGRTLREAPAKRVLYQPETTPARPRMATSNSQPGMNTPQMNQSNGDVSMRNAPPLPFTNGTLNTHSSGPVYQPQHLMGPAPRPVPTPVTAPGFFPSRKRKTAAEIVNLRNQAGVIGANFPGPVPIQRAIMGIKSGIPSEVDVGVAFVLKYGHDFGDELKLKDWAGLSERLLEMLNSLDEFLPCRPVKVKVLTNGRNSTYGSMSPESIHDSDVVKQTSNNIDTLSTDKIHTHEWITRRNKVFEAGLSLRNAVIMEENARYLATLGNTKEVLVKVLGVVGDEGMELKMYALEMIEQMATYMTLDEENDPLFDALQESILSKDRGETVTAMRALARLVIKDDTNQIGKLSPEVLSVASQYLLLHDEDMISAVLDLLYQYTSSDENVEPYLESESGLDNVKQITRLLSYGFTEEYETVEIQPRTKVHPPLAGVGGSHIANLPADLVNALLLLTEPTRAGQWMKCAFESDPHSEITQIALWQAYQTRFTQYVQQGRPLLPAADFIKNVSVAFGSATAMVVPANPATGQPQKFIIKGIRPRRIPLSIDGVEYLPCPWKGTKEAVPAQLIKRTGCDQFKLSPKDLYYHILEDHLVTTAEQRKIPQVCWYGDCRAFYPHGTTDRNVYVPHIRCHMPDKNPAQTAYDNAKKGLQAKSKGIATVRLRKEITPVDEKGEPAGVPFSAALVLRNLSRAKKEENRKKFGVAKDKVFQVMSDNKAMGEICSEIWTAFLLDGPTQA